MPNADYTGSNSAQIMGAMVAKVVSLSNTNAIHYDESLSSITNPFPGGTTATTVTSWQEI